MTQMPEMEDEERAEGDPRDRRSPGVRPWEIVVVVVGLCLLSGMIGWWLGQPGDESFSAVDTGFLSDMTLHHQGAIQMSFEYLSNENDSLVGHFAREIITSQSQEVAQMNNLLVDAGSPANATDDVSMDWMGMGTPAAEMPGMASEADFERLRAARGIDADDQFTELMIRHHDAGATMAAYAARRGRNERVRRAAAGMAAVQRREIVEMNQRRVQLGLAPVELVSGSHRGNMH